MRCFCRIRGQFLCMLPSNSILSNEMHAFSINLNPVKAKPTDHFSKAV